MRGRFVLHGTKPHADIEFASFRRCRPQTNQMEYAVGAGQQLSNHGGADAATTVGLSHVDMPQPTDPILVGIGIAVQATNRDQLACPECTKEHLAGLSKSVRAAAPLANQLLHKAKTFCGGFGAQRLDASGKIEKRRDA